MDNDFIHKKYPKRFARDDFWSQIKRTVNGKPVTDEDIGLIVDQISNYLSLQKGSHLLDLGCGNAALASVFFNDIDSYTGVDFSSYLLEIANEYFRPSDKFNYVESDILDYVANSGCPDQIDNILCYGCASYLSSDDMEEVVNALYRRFSNANNIFIGNLPDKNKAKKFFEKRSITDYVLDDHKSPIGLWWNPDELEKMCRDAGFLSSIVYMPNQFYASEYRFDLVLKRI